MQNRRLQFLLLFLLTITACQFTDNVKESKNTKVIPDEKYTMQGKILAQTAGSHLMSKLSLKISDKGIKEAITYCNLVAEPILDSLSQLYQAQIRRRSDRYRNPINRGDSLDQAVIGDYRKLIEEGLQPVSKSISASKDEVRFYAPIFTKALCLNCHGTPNENIAPENLSVIQELYPSDKAINFRIGELRGIWSITFQK